MVSKNVVRKVLSRRGQVAMEYLIVFAMAFVMLIPLVLIFATQSENIKSDITAAQLEKLSSELADAAQEVYYMGTPAQKTVQIVFPDRIRGITIQNRLILIDVAGSDYEYQFVKETTINLTGSLGTFSGPHFVVIKATDNGVVDISDRP